MKTFYQRWIDDEAGYTNLGGFLTALMKCYYVADNDNREKLESIYPEYFVNTNLKA